MKRQNSIRTRKSVQLGQYSSRTESSTQLDGGVCYVKISARTTVHQFRICTSRKLAENHYLDD